MIEHDEMELPEKKLVAREADTEEQSFEIGLRPQSLEEFVGQDALKEHLRVFIDAAKKRDEPLEHLLFYGNPGLGKTTLAHIVANEVEGSIRITSGPMLEKVGDLAAILSNLRRGDILFIDEIHRMNKTIEEVLYPAMEDYALDIIVGKGPTARTLRLNLEKFTIIGATTRLSLLSSPLRDRFGVTHHLQFYEEKDLCNIINRSAKILNVDINEGATGELAKRSRRTPRIANRLLRRVRDYADVKADGKINNDVAGGALTMLDIDEHGLDTIDRFILKTIIEKFAGGPVGITTIAAATQEETSTIEEVYEPYLMQLGFLHRTPRGRMVTERAYRHLGQTPPPTLL